MDMDMEDPQEIVLSLAEMQGQLIAIRGTLEIILEALSTLDSSSEAVGPLFRHSVVNLMREAQTIAGNMSAQTGILPSLRERRRLMVQATFQHFLNKLGSE